MDSRSLFISAFLVLASRISFAADVTQGNEYEKCNTNYCSTALSEKFHLDTLPLESDKVIGETFFVADDLPALYKTAFTPDSIVAVYNPRTGESYKEGADYTPSPEGIKLLPGSSIKGAPAGFSTPSAEDLKKFGVKSSTQILDYQYAVTYTKKEHYKVRTTGFLHKIKPSAKDGKIRITFFGDSIRYGSDTSLLKSQELQPGYVNLVMSRLEALHPGKYLYRNNSVPGISSLQASWWVETKLNDQRSDIIVLAFGMNDSNNLPPEKYRSNLENVIRKVRQKNPNTAFILVSSVRPNKDSKIHNHEYFNKYVGVLKELAIDNENINSIDLTNAWDRALKNKRFYDLSANGLHHPNDYAHRVIAEAVLSTLSDI